MDIKPSANLKARPRQNHIQKVLLIKNWVQFIATVMVLLLAFGLLVRTGVDWLNAQRIDTAKYQVVYLTNGQAYFGKLQNTSGEYLVMKTPYIAQSVQSADQKASDTTTLLKVSNQVYGPDDSIAIHSDQVSFWQNLRDDSKVTQAIKSKQNQ